MEWQPIETAPKDQTILVIGRDGGRKNGPKHYVLASWWGSGFVDRALEDGNRDLGSRLVHLTHWMPLPAAPKD